MVKALVAYASNPGSIPGDSRFFTSFLSEACVKQTTAITSTVLAMSHVSVTVLGSRWDLANI